MDSNNGRDRGTLMKQISHNKLSLIPNHSLNVQEEPILTEFKWNQSKSQFKWTGTQFTIRNLKVKL